MCKYWIVIVCLLHPFFGMSQKAEKKAFIVLNSGERIQGLVNDKEWIENPDFISFKKEQEGTYTKYTANQIKEVKIEEGDTYISATVLIDSTPLSIETDLPDAANIKFKQQTVFLLEEFFSTSFSLYSLRKKDRTHYFIREKEDVPVELVRRIYMIKKNGGTYELEDNQYLQQLKDYLLECGEAMKKINKGVAYAAREIVNVLKLHAEKCTNQTSSGSSDVRKKGNTRVYVIAGMSKTDLQFTKADPNQSNSDLTTKNKLDFSPSIAAGLQFNFQVNRLNEKLSFPVDIYFNNFSAATTEFTNYISPAFYTEKTLKINITDIRSKIAARYSFGLENSVRLFAEAGIKIALIVSDNSQVTYDEYFNNVHTIITRDPFAATGQKKLQLGFAGGTGLTYKRFVVFYNYETTTGISNAALIKSTVGKHVLMAGFRLSKK